MTSRLTTNGAVAAWCVALVVLLHLAGCGGTESEETEGDFSYPLEVGNRWDYRQELRLSITPVPPWGDPGFGDTTFVYQCSIEVTRVDSLSPFVDAYMLHEHLTQDTTAYESERWYRNEPDGLYLHAYRFGGSWVAPKAARGYTVVVGGVPFADIRDLPAFLEGGGSPSAWDPDSLIYEDPPLLALAYPPTVGYQWMYHPPSDPWHVAKRITGTASVAVPAGGFECYVIQWLVDFNEDGQWEDDLVLFDYVASEGLVRRWLYAWGWAMDAEGDTIGFLQTTEEYELTSLGCREDTADRLVCP